MKLMRLLKGALGVFIFYYVFFSISSYEMSSYERSVQGWFSDNIGESVSEPLTDILSIVFYITVLYLGVRGLFKVVTFNKVPEFAEGYSFRADIKRLWTTSFWSDIDDFGGGSNRGLDKFKAYRDSKLAGMGQKEAAEEYAKTAWVDGLTSNGSKQANRAQSYIDSALGGKGQAEGYSWIRDKSGS
jgi:hypothetical protein